MLKQEPVYWDAINKKLVAPKPIGWDDLQYGRERIVQIVNKDGTTKLASAPLKQERQGFIPVVIKSKKQQFADVVKKIKFRPVRSMGDMKRLKTAVQCLRKIYIGAILPEREFGNDHILGVIHE